MNKYMFLLFLLISGNVLYAQSPLKKDSAAVPAVDEHTFTKVEIEPTYPGGGRAWARYLEKKMVYPGKARRQGVEGEVMVRFVVDIEGHVSNPQAVKGDALLLKEAIRLVKDSGLWTSAIQGGRRVRAYKLLTITFQLPKNQE